MKKKLSIFTAMAFTVLSLTAQDKALPSPAKNTGLPLTEAFAQRKSTRSFSAQELTDRELGTLLWCAMGTNRADGRLTAPSCRNFQEIRLFVFDKKGVSEYIPASHSLRWIAGGDHRHLVAAGQDFVNTAPISLVIIADMGKFGDMEERSKMMASVDAGIVSENISLACAGLGLATVPRATMKGEEIISLLNLPAGHIAIMNNPVGLARTE